MSTRDLAALISLAALWGGSFLLIRVAVPVLGPAPLIYLRVFLAAGALGAYAAATGCMGGLRSHWRRFLILGGLNAALPFTLIATSEINLTASLAAILNATTPLFAALAASAWIGEALTARKLLGLLVGIAGVALVVGWNPLSLSPVVILSACASLAAALSYGFGGVYAKRAFPGVPPLTMALGQQAGATVVVLPFAAATLPAELPSVTVSLSALALALFCTALAYLLYFHLITNVGPTKTLTVTFLVPVFGVLFGTLFLGEPFGAGTLVGLGVILVSVALVTGVGPGRTRKGEV